MRLTVPTEPPARERGRFPLIAILLPLVAGVALVAITRSPTYLLFVLLSPLMALGTFWSDRTGGRKSARAQAAAHAEALDRVDQAVTRAVADEESARHSAHPGPAALALTVSGPRPRLWERRPVDDDALELRLGLGSIASTSRCERRRHSAAEASMRSSIHRSTRLPSPCGWPRPASWGWPDRGTGCCRSHVRWSPSWRAGTAHGTCAWSC